MTLGDIYATGAMTRVLRSTTLSPSGLSNMQTPTNASNQIYLQNHNFKLAHTPYDKGERDRPFYHLLRDFFLHTATIKECGCLSKFTSEQEIGLDPRKLVCDTNKITCHQTQIRDAPSNNGIPSVSS